MLRAVAAMARCGRARSLHCEVLSVGAWNGFQSVRWGGSRAQALEALSELDELLEDELIEEETHAAQLQCILGDFGVKSREDLLKGTEPEATKLQQPELAETEKAKQARVQRLKEQLRELDELLEDELIDEEVHAEQRKHLLAASEQQKG